MRRATRAVFLDKDGTLVEDVPYNVDPDRVRLTPGAGRALAALRRHGYRLAVVSNQSGVARGCFEEQALEDVARRLDELLAPHGVALDGFFYCPHLPAAGCGCRKPAAGLLHRAARALGVGLDRSWMVGDILHDVEAGHAAGCRSVLVDRGHETEWLLTPARRPDVTVADLPAAAAAILAADRPRLKRAQRDARRESVWTHV